MPSYLQLQSEQVWWDQFVPPNLTNLLINPLQAFYHLGGGAVGSAGDNNHLYGRHRSANWDLTSRYCTDRSYGTTNSKDKQGDLNWYRAVDVGIQGQPLWDASHRVDQAVRAGKVPAIAEWFGTFDGQIVVGWFEGNPSSSDDSHLWHLHIGLWNQYANDANVMRQIYGIITGLSVAQGVDDMLMIAVAGTGAQTTYWAGTGMESRQLVNKTAADNLIGALKIYGVPDPKILSYGGAGVDFVHQILGPPAVTKTTNPPAGG